MPCSKLIQLESTPQGCAEMSGPSAEVKKKRVVLSSATKLQIVERTEKGESIAKLPLEFDFGDQTVHDIV